MINRFQRYFEFSDLMEMIENPEETQDNREYEGYLKTLREDSNG